MPYKDKAQARANQRRWYARNKERIAEERRRLDEADPVRYAAKLEYQRKYREKALPRMRARHYVQKYGITEQERDERIAQQCGACAICKRAFVRDGNHLQKDAPVIDHCHTTGAVRGILCNKCNRGIGFLGDSAALCEVAAQYLAQHGCP